MIIAWLIKIQIANLTAYVTTEVIEIIENTTIAGSSVGRVVYGIGKKMIGEILLQGSSSSRPMRLRL